MLGILSERNALIRKKELEQPHTDFVAEAFGLCLFTYEKLLSFQIELHFFLLYT